MNLKLVVASMSALGLVMVSCPTLAAATTTTTSTTSSTVKHKHHHHHHKMMMTKHHEREVAPQEVAEHRDYKDMGPAPVEVCTVSQSAMVLDGMTQNYGRSLPNPCNPGWFNRVQLSGGVNVDAGKFGNRNIGYMGENYQRLSLNDAYINVAANVNDWTRMFASLSFGTPTTIVDGIRSGEYSAAYANNIQGTSNNVIQLEQAYATFGNFDQSPIFLQVGKQFQDFSRYEIHPITRSMTQVMSETLATSIKLGFVIPSGFNGSIALFDDPVTRVGHSSTTTNYLAALGYDMPPCDQFGWDLGAAYIYNMVGVNDIAYATQNFTGDTGYHTHIGGVAVYGDVSSGPFSLSARYTTTVQRFSPLDIPRHGVADLLAPGVVSGAASGAKPWTAGIQAGYGFDGMWGKNQNIYIGYQHSKEASGLNLPRNRYLAGIGIDMWRNTDFGLEWDHDQAYSVSHGGHGDNTNLVSLRAAVKFS